MRELGLAGIALLLLLGCGRRPISMECATHRCGWSCCTEAQQCARGMCCDAEAVCGSTCCQSGEVCVHQMCCAAEQVCDAACCAPGFTCVLDRTQAFAPFGVMRCRQREWYRADTPRDLGH